MTPSLPWLASGYRGHPARTAFHLVLSIALWGTAGVIPSYRGGHRDSERLSHWHKVTQLVSGITGMQSWGPARRWCLGRKAESRWHIPHLGSRAGPLPPLLPEAAQPVGPSLQACAPLSWNQLVSVQILCGGRKGRTNEEFAWNAYFLKTINNQNSLEHHGNCFEK